MIRRSGSNSSATLVSLRGARCDACGPDRRVSAWNEAHHWEPTNGARSRSGPFCRLGVFAAALSCAATVSPAAVNLEWRIAAPSLHLDDTIRVGLYAVSDSEADQSFAGLDAIVTWDPTVLEFAGKVDDGPFAWTASWFPDDRQLDGLNADCGRTTYCEPFTGFPYNDGEALYDAFALVLDPPPLATPSGLLVTTLLFHAVDASADTYISIIDSAGDLSATRVVDATQGETTLVTGSLGSLRFSIIACGRKGDFDGDCAVQLADIDPFALCMSGPDAAPPGAGCEPADAEGTGDGDVDLRDFSIVQRLFTTPE